MTILDPADCPFPDFLLARRFAFEGIPLTEAELARCLKARRQPAGKLLERLTVKCSPKSGALPAGMRPAYPSRAHHHFEMLFAGRRVHIEGIVQELSSPGGLNKELRVYVAGALEGRSILLGRLGGTVNTFPVVATIGPDAVMTVTPVRWTSLEELVVELWQHRRDQTPEP